MRKTDRVLVLEKVDPKKDVGMVDPKVFSGDNELHAVMDSMCMWSFKYKHGQIPPALKSRWTSFNELKKAAEKYFDNKNIKITKVID